MINKKFITFEGLDGSGKSTVIKFIKKYIEEKYDINNFVFTREPGGNNLDVAEKIREIILDNKNDIDNLTEALLYVSSRNIHVNKIIKPALESNKYVICDRFIDSSIAYQGHARGLGMERIEKLNLMIVDVLPAYTFYFRINTETSLKRLKNLNQGFDRLEKEGKQLFNKVLEAYEILATKHNDRYIIIDATKPIENVISEVIKKIENIILKKDI